MGLAVEALFVRLPASGADREERLTQLRQEWKNCGSVTPENNFIIVSKNKSPSYKQPDLAEVSRKQGELISITYDTYGQFMYDHWIKGKCIRSLFYSDEEWTRDTGNAEGWENNRESMDADSALDAVTNHFRLPLLV